MGSCEYSCGVLCMKVAGKLDGADPAGHVNAGCSSHVDGLELVSGVDGWCSSVEDSGNGVKGGPASAVDRSLELSQSDGGNAGCLSRVSGVKEIVGVDGRCGLVEELVLGDECGVRPGCFGQGQNGRDGDILCSQEPCVGKVVSTDEHYVRMVSSLEHSVKVMSTSCGLWSCDQQGEAKTDEGLRAKSVSLANGNHICLLRDEESHLAPVTDGSNNDEQGLKDVCTICSLSVDGGGFVKQHKKTGQGINHLSSYDVIQDFAEEKIEQCIKISSPHACNGTLEILPLADSPNNFAPKSELTDERSLVSPFMDRVSEAVVGKTDVHTIDTKVATCVPILCLKENGYEGGSLSETTLKPSIEKPALQDSDQLLGVAEDNLSSISDRPHISSGDAFGETKSDITADFSGQSFRPNCLSQSSPLVSSSTSQGRKQGCTKSKKTQRKHSARKCRNGTPNLGLNGHLESLISVRRKRSSFSKPLRASIWGLLGNITQLFMPGDGCESNQNQSHGSRHLKGSHGSGKQNSIMAGSCSRDLDGKSSVTRIHLKVKLGNQANKSMDAVNTDIIHTSESDDTVICGSGTDSFHRTSSGVPNLVHGVQDKVEDEKSEKQLLPLENKLEKASTSLNGSIGDFFPTNKNSRDTMVSAVLVGDAAEEYLRASSHLEVETLEAVKEKRDAGPATSPDSEVSNFVPDGQLRARGHKNIPSSALFSSERGEDKCTINQEGGYFVEEGSSNAVSTNKVKPLKKRAGRLDSATDNCFDEIVGSSASGNGSCNSSSSKGLSPEQVPYSTETEIEVLREAFQVERGTEAQVCGSLYGDDMASELQNSETLLPSTKSKGRRLRRKSDAVSKRRSFISAPKSRQCNDDDKKKGNEQNMANMNKLKEKRNCNHVQIEENDSETGKCIKNEVGQINGGDHIASTNVAVANITSAATEQYLPVDNAWVRCDDCHKWRRISEELADSIGQTNCRWICEDNKDKAFTDCSIPQEMSNSEINAELGIADADEDVFDIIPTSVASECSRTTVYKEYQFLRISTNQFLHRSRKTQTIDEIMVCGCKPPQDGSLGCRDGCLNRMLNIECMRGTCPCGDLCSNQQFQKRNYAKMKWDRCGKKGFGLRLDEDIYKGQFLIEYVGEVLDMRTYQARLKEYASMGHKHFYFMTLSSSEVIDASAKGNLGRFINHSCDPNCRTEKWVVNGEICIGLFALRDVKKGEEVTFDYNYVRVVGAAAKKCYCGSLQCRGYIGGDPTNAEIVDHVDSDEEFPEPVMLEEGETGNVFRDGTTRTSYLEEVEMQVFESMSVDGSFMAKSNGTTAREGVASETEESTDPLPTSMDLDGLKRSSFSPTGPVDVPQQVEYESIRPISSDQPEILMENNRNKTSAIQPDVVPRTPLLTKLSSDCTVAANKSKSPSAGEKRVFVKSRFYIKTSGQSGILKNGKHSENPSNSRKVKVMPNRSETHSLRPKTLLEGVANGRFETVEEKLNELLDVDGGISKRKDSPRGYLQLLHLIAASGSSGNGETIQSNRDLSMILDAILKTKSRMVLVDIINKNVLQKLHNMMKKCRRDFKKLPILRKVLKVLEFLAIREALKLEHISKGPPHPGVESFIESMLSLTEHDDKQVHQIARSFRDRWIPRHVRKICSLDRKTRLSGGSNSNKVPTSHNMQDDGIRPTETLDTVPEFPTTPVDVGVNGNHSASCIGGGAKTRKRKTRWDQDKPVWISTNCDGQMIKVSLEQVSELKTSHNIVEETPDRLEREDVCHPHAACTIDDGKQNTINDVPPGFSSSVSKKTSSVFPLTITDMLQQASPESLVIGHPQKKFISRLPVSYGIPLPIVRQLGPSQAEIVESCIIAPGIAFHPFPPLPPVVHPSKGNLSLSANSKATRGASETQQGSQNPAASYVTENSPSTSGANQSGMDHPGPNDQQAFKRPKVSSHDLGRRYFRQQKWHKMPAPWIRNGTRWGYSGNNLRAGMCARNIGNPAKQHMDSSFQMM